MKKIQLLLSLTFLLTLSVVRAQQTETKNYPAGTHAGDVYLLYTYGDYDRGNASRIYVVDVLRSGKYYLSTLTNMRSDELYKVYVDNSALEYLVPSTNGWQLASIRNVSVSLTTGKHMIKIYGNGPMVPMVEEIKLTTAVPQGRDATDATSAFLDKINWYKQQPVVVLPGADEVGDLTNKVLPNPLGTYDHVIDTTFAYSHYSTVYLTAGNHTFTTSGSTTNRALTVFNTTNYDYSWSNVNGGPGGESGLYLIVGLSGYYSIMLRPVVNGTSGTTNIILDGSTLVSNAVIGGKTYAMSSLKGGPLNFFTCKLTGGDTRMIASRYFSSSARGYNDDYYGGGGDWSWGLASRIKKDFSGSDSVQYGYVCAYSPTSTGTSDVYLGNQNSDVNSTNFPEFPLLKADDAIKAAPSTGAYNCISWSGGVTAAWIWPPSQYSTYNCPNNSTNITCFDNFYSNNPVRYPGAWNYTRTGATVNNSVVDVWALNGYYTHGSVRKPGNNHPHGYDWESKPGGTTRTFHPRNALTNNSFGYGSVVNYYIATGTYARNGGVAYAFESDEDAVKAGVAVFENAKLTSEANSKLKSLTSKVESRFTNEFNDLYEAWKKTWAANAIYSDPAAYCKNPEFNALVKLAQQNGKHAMLLTFEKFVGGDHLVGELMCTLTKEKYSNLLTEVKTERAANPNDAMGRYRVHGDHDNGVLYVEKILKTLQNETDVVFVADAINATVSPNPVKDRLTVQVVTTKSAKVSVQAISSQTRLTKVLQPETVLGAGTHRFSFDITGFAGNTGDIIAVQVIVDGVMKTVKVLVTK